MKYTVSSKQMQTYDRNTQERIGIPGMVLMERAALSVKERVLEAGKASASKTTQMSVLVMAGVGNNGGDGLAIARLLAEEGMDVSVFVVGDEEKASEQWKAQMHILKHYPVSVTHKLSGHAVCDVCVDALFGVGLSREVTGIYADAVRWFNTLSGYKIAADLPSGVDGDSGKILGCCVRADETVTFGFVKRGLFLFPASDAADGSLWRTSESAKRLFLTERRRCIILMRFPR